MGEGYYLHTAIVPPMVHQWVVVVGLLIDLAGVVVIGVGVFVTWLDLRSGRPLRYKEDLAALLSTRYNVSGAVLLVAGLILQIVGQWPG